MDPVSGALPTRTVVAVKDPTAPLWSLRCVTPCERRPDFCMRRSVWQDKDRAGGFCYLGSDSTKAGVEAYARRLGYTVEAAV